MTPEQIAGLGLAFTSYLQTFRDCFVSRNTFRHLHTYCRGLLSDLPRKSVEPIALASGTAVRTLQEFLADHQWDHGRMRDQVQRRFVNEHVTPPGPPEADAPEAAGPERHDLGVVGWIDETSDPKKGDKTPGVQRQYCGHSGKIDNCIVTVHLAAQSRGVMALLDSDLFLPEHTWDADRDRCRRAHIPDGVVYRSKWRIALDQLKHARANGLRLDWLTFDQWYGGKPQFLFELDGLGQHYVAEVPVNFMCFPTRPKYHSLQAAFAPKRVDKAVVWGKPFRNPRNKWRTIRLRRQTLAPEDWLVKAAQVYLCDPKGRPTDRTYWLIVANNPLTAQVKYFVSNAPPRTALATLIRVAFTRPGVEHVFRLAKSEIGFDHFEGRSYQGLLRHMILCQLLLLFVAEQTWRFNLTIAAEEQEKKRPTQASITLDPATVPCADAHRDDGADRPRAQHLVSAMAGPPLRAVAD